jgi:dipeptidyl aminopeptidase/acylaminoacyl peptidase
MVADVPGDGTLRDLTPDYEAHVSSFAWKDAQTLVWVAYEGTGTTVGEAALDGQKRVLVKGAGPVLSRVSLSEDGRKAAFVGNTPTYPNEVFLLAEGSDAARRMTDSNPWLANMRFARQEAVRWKARDGLELEGVLVYPVNYQAGRRYPLILYVHGGPESHISNGWVTYYVRPGQVGAARGFAVFYPNYRGSTGRGVTFAKLGQADAAGREFDDFVDAVDHLVAVGLVDKDKVGITGGSYGGYASAWGATYYSDRFAASVMFVGISDNISKLGTTDIPEEVYLVHHRKRLWEDWDYFLRSSPIRYVERNRTPTLILHGKNDPRVHPSQSMELYRHLKTLGQAPVRLVWYPGEGHGNRRAAARFDYNVRMLRWMEHYLQGPGGDAPDYGIDYDKEFRGE